MSVKTEHVVHCDHTGCGKFLDVTGQGATIHTLWEKARKAGWTWKNASTQYCPDHAPAKAKAEKKAKPAKKASAPKKAASKKPAAKRTYVPKRKVASLPGVPDVSDRPAE